MGVLPHSPDMNMTRCLFTIRPTGWANVLAPNCPRLTCQSARPSTPTTITRDILRNSLHRAHGYSIPLRRLASVHAVLRRLIAQRQQIKLSY